MQLLLSCSQGIPLKKISPYLSFLIYRTGEMGNLTAPCNANCNCLRSYYYPLCGSDGVQYFSPCFAGCLNSVSNRKPKVAMFPFTPMNMIIVLSLLVSNSVFSLSLLSIPSFTTLASSDPILHVSGNSCRTQCGNYITILYFWCFSIMRA